MLSLLEIGGAFYTVLPAVHLEDGTDKLGTWYKTELVNAASRPVKVCSWLRQSTCTDVSCESKPDWDEPTQLIKIGKLCSGVFGPAHESCGVHGGDSPRQTIPIGAGRALNLCADWAGTTMCGGISAARPLRIRNPRPRFCGIRGPFNRQPASYSA